MKKNALLRRLIAIGALCVFSSSPLSAQTKNHLDSILPFEPGNPFSLKAEVSPSPAMIGTRLSLRLTITNSSQSPASFTIRGCPVHYRVDGAFSPTGNCGDLKRDITLEPGQNVSFGPRDTPHLFFDPRQFPVGPGTHRVVMATEGVGAAETEFVVENGRPHLASLAGRVLDLDGTPVGEGRMILSHKTNRPPQTTGEFENHDVASADLSDKGYFLFTDVEPRVYQLRVEIDKQTQWYPGVNDVDDAGRIVLSPGDFYRDVELTFRRTPKRHVFSGHVYDHSSSTPALPLAEAVVMALPVSGTDVPESQGTPGSLETAVPFFAMTGPDGSFRLDLPRGVYRLVAGKLVDHQYQYWNHSSGYHEASLIRVPQPANNSGETVRFDIQRFQDATLGELSGRVLLYHPETGLGPVPGVDVQITAVPVLPAPFASTAPHGIKTAKNGTFRLAVPADTPYLIRAETKGYRSPSYGYGADLAPARWVDVKPGQTRGSVDFVLLAQDPSLELGSISGSVFARLPDADCQDRDPNTCLVPAEGTWIQVSPAFPTLAPMKFQTRVGKDGSFRVDGLIAGRDRGYYVSAHTPGLDPRYAPGGVIFSEAASVAVYPGKTARADKIVLPPRGSRQDRGKISGIVTDRQGNPVDGALIRIYPRPDMADFRELRGITNSAGAFVFEGLPEGTQVLVSAEAPGFVPAYYPGVYRWKDAEGVDTGGPRRQANTVSLALDRGPEEGAWAQPGFVETTPGTPPGSDDLMMTLAPAPSTSLPGAFFYLLDPYSKRPEIPVAGGASGENGSVLLTGLNPGHYVAYADHPGYESGKFPDDSAPKLLWIGENASETRLTVRLSPLDTATASAGVGEFPALVTHLVNVPNPFRPQTAIRYQLEEPAPVTVQVFDYRGRLVRTLVEERSEDPGAKEIVWNGTDDGGVRVSSGVYFYRIMAGSYSVSRKMVLLP